VVYQIKRQGRLIPAKGPGDVVLMLRDGRIAKEDQIFDPDLGRMTVAEFIEGFRGAADTCATLELLIDDIRELRDAYKSCPPASKTKER
jgi:hypothetical protein